MLNKIVLATILPVIEQPALEEEARRVDQVTDLVLAERAGPGVGRLARAVDLVVDDEEAVARNRNVRRRLAGLDQALLGDQAVRLGAHAAR